MPEAVLLVGGDSGPGGDVGHGAAEGEVLEDDADVVAELFGDLGEYGGRGAAVGALEVGELDDDHVGIEAAFDRNVFEEEFMNATGGSTFFGDLAASLVGRGALLNGGEEACGHGVGFIAAVFGLHALVETDDGVGAGTEFVFGEFLELGPLGSGEGIDGESGVIEGDIVNRGIFGIGGIVGGWLGGSCFLSVGLGFFGVGCRIAFAGEGEEKEDEEKKGEEFLHGTSHN